MPLLQRTWNNLFWLSSSHIPVPHGMYTRMGGVSGSPHDTLNLSYGVGDDPQTVDANRTILKDSLSIRRLVSLGQVHGDRILTVKEGDKDMELAGYDALISDIPGTGLLIQQADCQAVLLHDPIRRVIGGVHCGWRGTVTDIISKTIDVMTTEYAVTPQNILALISPSLGPCCSQFTNHHYELPDISSRYRVSEDHFDFWAISRDQLRDAGIHQHNIVSTNICSSCDDRFFSYRRAVRSGCPITGRNGSVIALT